MAIALADPLMRRMFATTSTKNHKKSARQSLWFLCFSRRSFATASDSRNQGRRWQEDNENQSSRPLTGIATNLVQQEFGRKRLHLKQQKTSPQKQSIRRRRTARITRAERMCNHCPTATQGLAGNDWFVVFPVAACQCLAWNAKLKFSERV